MSVEATVTGSTVQANVTGGPGPAGSGLRFLGEWTDQLYEKDDVVEFAGSSYVCLATFTSNPAETPEENQERWGLLVSGFADAPSNGNSYSRRNGGWVDTALRAQLQSCDATDPYVNDVWHEDADITVTTNEANDNGLSKTYVIDAEETHFLPLTGPIKYYANITSIPYVGGFREPGATPLWSSAGHSMEFWTDAAKIQFRYPAGNNQQARVLVNNRFISSVPAKITVAGAVTVTINLPSAGVARLIRIDAAENGSVGQYAYVAAADTIWKPAKRLSFGLLGDSVAQTVEATLASDGYANALTKMLGMRGYIAAKSGTGYINRNGGTWANYIERLPADFTGLPLSLIIVQGSTNDSAYTSAQIQTAAAELWAELRRLYPAVPILVTSTPGSIQNADTTKINTALKTAFDAWGDANSRWFSYFSIIGSGSRYNIGNTHPATAGHIYQASILKNAIREWLG